MLFYGRRLESGVPLPKHKPLRRRHAPASKKRRDGVVTELRQGLAQLGMATVTDAEVRRALADAYPDGHGDGEPTEMLRAVFGAIQRRNTEDNVSG